MTREELLARVEQAETFLRSVKADLEAFDKAPENNRFDDLEIAKGAIEDRLLAAAELDCEGAYNYGAPEYTQKFYVGDTLYNGILQCQYNRHDKKYYYIEDYEFTTIKII